MQIHVAKYNSPCKFQLWVDQPGCLHFFWKYVFQKTRMFTKWLWKLVWGKLLYIYIYSIPNNLHYTIPKYERNNLSVFASLLYNTCFREQSCLQNMCDTHLGKELQIHIIYNHINCALFLILQITAMSKTRTFRRICDLENMQVCKSTYGNYTLGNALCTHICICYKTATIYCKFQLWIRHIAFFLHTSSREHLL